MNIALCIVALIVVVLLYLAAKLMFWLAVAGFAVYLGLRIWRGLLLGDNSKNEPDASGTGTN